MWSSCLGRVLRMPYAKRRKAAELNKAYAHVSSPNFLEAAKQLETCMIEKMGFEEAEAEQYLEVQQKSSRTCRSSFRKIRLRLTVAEPLKLEGLTEIERQSIVVKSEAPGRIEIEVHGQLTPQIQKAALAAVPEAERAERSGRSRATLRSRNRTLRPRCAAKSWWCPGSVFATKASYCRSIKSWCLDAASWDLSQCAVDLSDFRFNDTSKTFEFDVQGSKVVYAFKGEQQLDLNLLAGDWTETDLIRWLDKELRQPDIRQEASLAMAPALCSPALDAQGIRFGVAGAGEVHPCTQAGREAG